MQETSAISQTLKPTSRAQGATILTPNRSPEREQASRGQRKKANQCHSCQVVSHTQLQSTSLWHPVESGWQSYIIVPPCFNYHCYLDCFLTLLLCLYSFIYYLFYFMEDFLLSCSLKLQERRRGREGMLMPLVIIAGDADSKFYCSAFPPNTGIL